VELQSKLHGASLATKTKLERFAKLFPDEAALRLAVIGLLERMPNTSNIHHTHGTGELGKDIVFDIVSAFAQKNTIACVAKSSKITGSVSSNEGARTVYFQAEQCFDSPYVDIGGQRKDISEVFVISPFDCASGTISSICGKLPANNGRVKFLCGTDLMHLFESYNPEFLIFQSGMFGTYVADLEKGIQSDPAVSNLLLRSGFTPGPKILTDMYVQPRFSRRVSEYETHHFFSDLNLDFADRALSEAQVVPSIIALSIIAGYAEAFVAPSPDEQTLREVKLAAQSLFREWNSTFEEYRRRPDIRPEEKGRETARIQAPKLQPIVDRYRAGIDKAIAIYREFESTLRLSNKYVRKLKAGKKNIKTEELLAFGRVDSVFLRGGGLPYSKTKFSLPYVPSVLNEKNVDFLITAPAGFGKTSFCRTETLRDLKMLRDGASTRIPIYIPLHQLPNTTFENFEKDILRSEDLIDLWSSRRVSGKEEPVRKFRLYLDGIDEIPDELKQKSVMDRVEEAKRIEPELQIVITGREHVSGVHLARYFRLHVDEMEDGQVAELVSKWFGDSLAARESFLRQIDQLPQLKPVLKIPLLVTLVLGVYGSTDTLPQSRVALYEMFVSLLAGGWDIAKKVQRETQFGPEPKITVLIRLAGILHLASKRDANLADFRAAISNTLPGISDKSERMLQELVHDGFLVRTGNTYSFCHLSFQEFLAAKDLFDSKGRKAKAALVKFLEGDVWWRDVITFYAALSKNPKEMEIFIHENAIEVDAKANDDSSRRRSQYLLEDLMLSFPGAKPNFNIPYKKSRQPRLAF
jgi:hypothetical protein